MVDAAVGLQKRGHHVEVFTSHHEDGEAGRSFEETRDGEYINLPGPLEETDWSLNSGVGVCCGVGGATELTFPLYPY